MASDAADEELRLGRYTLKRQLGAGGNGQVFLAWQENAAGEPLVCVVKFPLQRFATTPEGRTRFMEEARLAMRLGTHVNIVHVIDVGVHREMPFIAMEYVDGTDLSSLLSHCRKREGLSLPTVYSILSGAAAGLHHAHAGATVARQPVGVVHRDIKPGNILVTRDGVTKLGDFGISTTIEDETTGSHMRGTYRYMSPEHIGREVCPEMDIYALGVVAWEMVENRRYRAGFEGTQHITAIMDGEIPPLVNPATPKEFAVIIRACLEPNPRQRPSAKELLRALEHCPGYTRYAPDLQDVISSVVGPHRSSGKTLHELAMTPELAATFAALKLVEEKKDRAPSEGDTELEWPATVAAPPGFVPGAPARGGVRHQEAQRHDPEDSEVETNELPRLGRSAGPGPDAHAHTHAADVPQRRRWKQATPPQPTSTVALSPAEQTPSAATVALDAWPADASSSGTALLPPPGEQAPPAGEGELVAAALGASPPPRDAEVAAAPHHASPPAKDAELVAAPHHASPPAQDAAVVVARGQTEPSRMPATPRPANAARTIETRTPVSDVPRVRGLGSLQLLLLCGALALGSALVVAYVLGAFNRPTAPTRRTAPEPRSQSLDEGQTPGRAPTKALLFLRGASGVKIGPERLAARRGTNIQVTAAGHRRRSAPEGDA